MVMQYHTKDKPNPEPERVHFIGREQSYHGASISALALGGYESRRAPFKELFSDKFHHLPACNEYRQRQEGQSLDDFNTWHANQLEGMIKEIGTDKVAAFIAEPVVGAVSHLSMFSSLQMTLRLVSRGDGCTTWPSPATVGRLLTTPDIR